MWTPRNYQVETLTLGSSICLVLTLQSNTNIFLLHDAGQLLGWRHQTRGADLSGYIPHISRLVEGKSVGNLGFRRHGLFLTVVRNGSCSFWHHWLLGPASTGGPAHRGQPGSGFLWCSSSRPSGAIDLGPALLKVRSLTVFGATKGWLSVAGTQVLSGTVSVGYGDSSAVGRT